MGVTSPLKATPSICLGTLDLSVKEITAAYSTFVNKGIYTEPIYITQITNKNGVIIEEFQPSTKEALNEKTAATMVNLLKGVVTGVYSEEIYFFGKRKGKKIGTRGTGASLRGGEYSLKSELGGKTGTTQNYSDGWFVGITPNLVTAIWTGCDDRSVHFNNYLGYGGNMALPTFGYFMRGVYDDESITEVTENDKFKYNSLFIKNWAGNQINCNQIENTNPEDGFNNEDF